MVDFKNAKHIVSNEMPKMIIYGRNGIGKSRFAMCAPNPIFLDLDRNLGQYKVISNRSENIEYPLSTFQNVLEFMSLLINEPHDFKTLVVDSLSSLEILIENQIKRENNVQSVMAIPFGKGMGLVRSLWSQFKSKVEYLWEKRGIMVILIGHQDIKKDPNLETGGHDMYKLAIDSKSAEILNNWCSVILFASDQVKFKEEISGFGKASKQIIDSKKVLCTQNGVLSLAKNTYNLPTFIPFDDVQQAWNTFAEHVFNKKVEEKIVQPIKGEK
jgi:hypothetical protein